MSQRVKFFVLSKGEETGEHSATLVFRKWHEETVPGILSIFGGFRGEAWGKPSEIPAGWRGSNAEKVGI